jgi:hypothetical protein
MPMKSQWAARITPHSPHMVRRFGDHLSLRRAHLTLFHSTFDVKRSVFDVHRPKEWWTLIRHAHGMPMCRENHSSWSPHGQAIRRSPLLAKTSPHALFLATFLRRKIYYVKKSFSFRDITAPRFRGIRCEEKFFPHLSHHHRETSTILSPASHRSTHTYFL